MDENIILFIMVGFIAQMIDGALGMAYGVASTTFLLSIGIPPRQVRVFTLQRYSQAVYLGSHTCGLEMLFENCLRSF